jgi:SpoIID/LytB domain protein
MIIKIQLTREENINHYQASVIEIDLEEYIRGVVPSEVGNAPLEACKAQAVAARSFALYRYKKSG